MTADQRADTQSERPSQHGTSASGPGRGYPDLHDHIEALRKAGLLIEVDRPINKDTEMHPLVRWQYSGGIPEDARRAFLFTNLTDSKARKFDIPVLVGGMGTNSAIYSVGIGCAVEEIRDKCERAAKRHDQKIADMAAKKAVAQKRGAKKQAA